MSILDTKNWRPRSLNITYPAQYMSTATVDLTAESRPTNAKWTINIANYLPTLNFKPVSVNYFLVFVTELIDIYGGNSINGLNYEFKIQGGSVIQSGFIDYTNGGDTGRGSGNQSFSISGFSTTDTIEVRLWGSTQTDRVGYCLVMNNLVLHKDNTIIKNVSYTTTQYPNWSDFLTYSGDINKPYDNLVLLNEYAPKRSVTSTNNGSYGYVNETGSHYDDVFTGSQSIQVPSNSVIVSGTVPPELTSSSLYFARGANTYTLANSFAAYWYYLYFSSGYSFKIQNASIHKILPNTTVPVHNTDSTWGLWNLLYLSPLLLYVASMSFNIPTQITFLEYIGD